MSFSVLGDHVVMLELDSKRQMFPENYELVRTDDENETLEMLESGENTVYVFDEARCDDVADIEGGYSHPARVDGVRCAAGRRELSCYERESVHCALRKRDTEKQARQRNRLHLSSFPICQY